MKNTVVRVTTAVVLAIALMLGAASPSSAATSGNRIRNASSSTFDIKVLTYGGGYMMLRPGADSQNVGYSHVQGFCLPPASKAISQWNYVYNNVSNWFEKCYYFTTNNNALTLTAKRTWLW